MPAFAPAVLAAAVALSAIGAVALCVLVVLYGFTPAGEEPPGETARRLIVTRVGHALAAACFTATAILIATVLVRSSAAPPAVPDARLPALDRQIAGQATRLSETERRLLEVEEAVRRRNLEATPPAATAPAPIETPVPPRRSAARQPGHPGRIAAPKTMDAPSTSPPAAPSTPAPPPVVTSPPPPPAASHTPPPVAASPRSTLPEPETPPARPAPRPGFDLRSKLREDWREIRRGVDSGEDDFRRALEGVKRNLGLGN